MRQSSFMLPLAASAVAAFVVVTAIFLIPDLAVANGQEAGQLSGCPQSNSRPARPKYADLGPRADAAPLDKGDEIAALASVQHALSTVGDGSTYVWRRSNGRLSGVVQPTSSFRDDDGAVCRHLILLLTTGQKTRKVEGIACRREHGVWSLDG